MNTRPEEPHIDRSITLQLKGDWGTANLHRVCGWISQELTDRAGPHTRIGIWNGRGFSDNVHAVGRGEVHVALTTPTAFAVAALDGRGVYRDEFYPDLRALGVVPQRDRLVVAVHSSLGVNSFAELRESKPALRVATSVGDGVNHVGLAAHVVLQRSGIDVLGWGGQFLSDERPFESLDNVLDGHANAIVHEAVMLPHWQQFGADYRFLEIEQEVLESLELDFGWPAATVDDGFFLVNRHSAPWTSPTSWCWPAQTCLKTSPTPSRGSSARPVTSSKPSTGTCHRSAAPSPIRSIRRPWA